MNNIREAEDVILEMVRDLAKQIIKFEQEFGLSEKQTDDSLEKIIATLQGAVMVERIIPSEKITDDDDDDSVTLTPIG